MLTLGCQMNLSDRDRVSKVLNDMGFQQTEHESEAQLMGILSCSVRQKAIDKVYSRISKWNKWKNKKNLITFVSGCILADDREKFLRLFDLVFPVSELNQFPDMLKQYGVVSPMVYYNEDLLQPIRSSETLPSELLEWKGMKEMNLHINEFWNIKPDYGSSFEAFVPIQNGCDKFCTFCAVPYTRGREVSRASTEILEEIENLILRDFKSITLLGQNVNSYGLDKKGEELTFPELLEQIGKIGERTGKDFWVYFTSPHPRDMTADVIDVISRYKCLAKQIHLPLQSGDDKVLIRMNRKHSVEKYKSIINKIKDKIPESTIFTDIIVGFTGETDAEFENTRKIMEEIKFNMAYIAMYSPRPGAASSRWADDVSLEEKKKRLHILSEVLRKNSLQNNKSLLKKKMKILVKGVDRKDGFLSAYNEGRIVCRFASDDQSLIGKFVEIEVIAASELSIEGKLC